MSEVPMVLQVLRQSVVPMVEGCLVQARIVTVTLTIPGCPGTVSQRPVLIDLF